MSSEKEFQTPRRHGSMGRGGMRGMVGGEKAKNFKGSFKKLLAYIGKYRFALFAVMVFATVSTVFFRTGAEGYGARHYGTGRRSRAEDRGNRRHRF